MFKVRTIDESRVAASFRANDRLKLVNAEKYRIEKLDSDQLNQEFKCRFGVPGKNVRRDEKIIRLVKSFVRNNRPSTEHRLAIKLYNHATKQWNRYDDTPLLPSIDSRKNRTDVISNPNLD
jgi:hypothetical protein